MAVSDDLRLLLGALLKMHLPAWPFITAFLISATAAAITPLALAASSLTTRDIAIG
jgi:hypothetical protein